MWSEHFCGSCSFSGIFFGDRSNMPAAYLRIVYIIARDDGYKISREEFLLSPPKNLGGRTFSPKKLDSFSQKNCPKPHQSLRNCSTMKSRTRFSFHLGNVPIFQ